MHRSFETIIGDEFKSIEFTKTEIVSYNFFPIEYQVACDEYFNFVFQWTGLKNGNWKILLEDIKNIADQENALVKN